MRIAIVELENRMNVPLHIDPRYAHLALRSIRAKNKFTSEPVFTEKNGQRYLLIGVEHG